MAVTLGKLATKLAAWLGIYRISATNYNNRLTYQNYEVNPGANGSFSDSGGSVGRYPLPTRGTFKSQIQELKAETLTSLAAPSSLAGTVSTGQIALSWSAVSHATGYKVERSTTNPAAFNTAGVPAPGFVKLYTGSATSFTDTTTVAGLVYYYRVTGTTGEPLAAQTYQETYSYLTETAQ